MVEAPPFVEGNECEPTRAMTSPVIVELAPDGNHPGRVARWPSLSLAAACSPDATHQRVQGAINSGNAKQRDENADWLGPVICRSEHSCMQRQHQIKHRHLPDALPARFYGETAVHKVMTSIASTR